MCLDMSRSLPVCGSFIDRYPATMHVNHCGKMNIDINNYMQMSYFTRGWSIMFVLHLMAFNPTPLTHLNWLHPWNVSCNWIGDNLIPQSDLGIKERRNMQYTTHYDRTIYAQVLLFAMRLLFFNPWLCLSSIRELHQPCRQSLCQNPSYPECPAVWRALTTSLKMCLSERTGSMGYR